jgi:hypothetical protein
LQLAISENRFLEAGLIKGRMNQLTALKRKRKTKFVTIVKPKPQHFRILELNVAERGFIQLDHTQIAGIENAIGELISRKVGISKVAMVECAILVFSLLQYFESVKGLVGDLHGVVFP